MTWYCPICKKTVGESEVTYDEYHEKCGSYLGCYGNCQTEQLEQVKNGDFLNKNDKKGIFEIKCMSCGSINCINKITIRNWTYEWYSTVCLDCGNNNS